MRWFYLCLCLSLGGLLAVGAGAQWLRATHLYRQGIPAAAVVVENLNEQYASSSSTGRNPLEAQYALFPRFRFTTPDGAVHLVKRGVGSSPDPEFAEGATVQVRYPAGRPDEAEIYSFQQFWLGPLALTGLGVVLLAAGVIGFRVMGPARSPRPRGRFGVGRGIALRGRVTRVESRQLEGETLHQVAAVVRQRDGTPRTYSQLCLSVTPDLEGREITVWVDPEDDTRVAFELPAGRND